MDQVLKETLQTCNIHKERMLHAAKNLSPEFPLDKVSYSRWDEFKITLCDQLIYRFSKLQDSMGKLFRLILEVQQEDTERMTFKDILLRLEKLNIIEDHTLWINLRELRNTLTHEYPENTEEIIQGLNQLMDSINLIESILTKAIQFIQSRID